MNGSPAFTDRTLILLSDESRFERRKALLSIRQLISNQAKTLGASDFDCKKYAPALATSLNDNIEVNRELAISVVRELLESMSDCAPVLPSLIPELVKRLGQKDIVEPSEELRLETLRLVHLILNNPVDMSPYVDDVLMILQYVLRDSFPEVKKLSCTIAQELARRKLHRFYQNSESILNPLLSNFVHQHSKVRVCAVQATGTVMLYSQGKLVDQTIVPLTQRLFDTTASVRRSVIEVVGCWLLELPDRYSYHTKLMPLILSGLLDESDEIRTLSEELWDDIGLKYEKENEEQLKDKLDFEKKPPKHRPLGCKRPVLGCRELVYRSASRLLPALCRDLGDWQTATRSKAAGLIPILILHLEECTTQHTQHLLTGIGTGLTDAVGRIGPSTSGVALLRLVPPLAFKGQPLPTYNLSVNHTGPETLVPRIPTLLNSKPSETTEALKVIQQLLLAAQLIGSLVEAKLWWQLLKPCLDRCTESNAPASLAGHLFLLAGLVSGAPHDQLTSLMDSDRTMTEGSDTSSSILIHHIVVYLINSDLLSVISFGAKAALLECASMVVRRLEEAIVRLRSGPNTDSESTEKTAQDRTAEDVDFSASDTILVQDKQLRSWLFEILLAVGAVWADNESCATDFGSALLQLTDEVMRRLASCERDYGLYSKDPDYECLQPRPSPGPESGQPFYQTSLLEPAIPDDLDRFYVKHMLPLFQRLKASQTESGSWHPRSVGLAIFSRCLQTSGPALLMKPSGSTTDTCLDIVLQLLEQGCRLNRSPGASATDKSPVGTDPLTMASEAELRLRGLLLLTRLTDNGPIRTVLASPTYLNRCLTQLVLPACVWRAGRTAEAMRKAAVTCLVALLAAATSTYDVEETATDSRTAEEVRLDLWLADHIESVKRLLGPKALQVDRTPSKGEVIKPVRISSLSGLSAQVLSLLLTRLGGLLEDDIEATRRMACLNLTILFNGLLLPPTSDMVRGDDIPSFLSSPSWLSPVTATQDQVDHQQPASLCPLPNSFGDQVYRFYPNLVRRLNDAKDPVRMLVTETLNAWLRLVHEMLVCDSNSVQLEPSKRRTLNPVHSAIVQDFLAGVMPHLDDANEPVRAAVARVLGRLGQIAPDLTREALVSARERHRASELCHQLAESIHLSD
ncbi:Dynein assembly factor 5, axonemal [Clonorchis sinensis]|uniref:Dynein assembly factor 5, axonemal n=1 Tax=Clonorchis sinensis TaxID=79923 RepID=A0A3R7CIM5_CLOSI|nr:Dynein assembly factor 5, axonemal [Clonorchis sinensis]